MRSAFRSQWEDESGKYIIRKTVGFEALMHVLRNIVPIGQADKDLSEIFFRKQVEVFARNLGDPERLTSEYFKSSSSEATRLAKTLLGTV